MAIDKNIQQFTKINERQFLVSGIYLFIFELQLIYEGGSVDWSSSIPRSPRNQTLDSLECFQKASTGRLSGDCCLASFLSQQYSLAYTVDRNVPLLYHTNWAF